MDFHRAATMAGMSAKQQDCLRRRDADAVIHFVVGLNANRAAIKAWKLV